MNARRCGRKNHRPMLLVVGYGSAGVGSVSHSLGYSPQRQPRTENIADSNPKYAHRQQAAHSHLRPGLLQRQAAALHACFPARFLRAAAPVGCLSLTCSSRLHLIGGLRHSHHTMPTLNGKTGIFVPHHRIQCPTRSSAASFLFVPRV